MNPIEATFATAKTAGKTVFLPFITAGDPDLATTAALIQQIDQRAQRKGVPIIFEIGFPYSDPIADGAAIQASYCRALDKKIKIQQIFDLTAKLQATIKAPLVGMVSYSLVHRRGPEKFVADAKSHGLSGLIVPDLPPEEGQLLRPIVAGQGLSLIQLIAPTSAADRVPTILQSTSGFVYCVSLVGITGERAELSAELPARLKTLRTQTTLPIAVGFGISRPEHVAALKGQADGVIVGSAIVKRLADLKPGDAVSIGKFADFVETLLTPLGV